MRTLLPYCIMIIVCLNVFADNIYFSKYTGFGDFGKCTGVSVADDALLCSNKSSENQFYLQRYPDDINSYVFEINLANTANIEGKKLSYIDDGDKKITTNVALWGIVWAYKNNDNYQFLNLKCNNRDLDDLYDQRCIEYEIGFVKDGLTTIKKEDRLIENINLFDGYSKFRIVYNSESVEVLCGLNKYVLLNEFYSVMTNNLSYGYYAGPGVSLKMNKAVLRYTLINKPVMSKYTVDSLNIKFKNSNNPVEGYWIYLDRNIQNQNVKLGGKYKLAIVRDGDSYLILYIDGQQRDSQRWQPCSVKGKLYTTDFEDTYNLVWYDTLNSEISDDAYVQLKDNKILEFKFPVQKSSMRFVKE